MPARAVVLAVAAMPPTPDEVSGDIAARAAAPSPAGAATPDELNDIRKGAAASCLCGCPNA